TRANNRAPGRPTGDDGIPTAAAIGGQQPKLGGLFEGLSSMPKLKPVGSRTGAGTGNVSSPASGLQQNKTPSPDASKGSPINNGRLGNGGGSAPPLDFSDELAQKLTLKKQKHQQQGSNSVPPAMNPPPTVPNEANLRLNRGPPPQPPTSIQQRPTGDNSASKTAPTSSQKSQAPATPNHLNHHLKLGASGKPSATNGPMSSISSSTTAASAATTSPTNNATGGSAPIPNRSALFGGNTTPPTVAGSVMGNGSVPTVAAVPVAPKPVPNYGKPNLAPKPPGMQLGGGTAGDGGSATRPTVSRHQSMRSPRSPPVSQTAPAFPANHFGTMRGPPSSAAMFQSSESIVRPVQATGRPSAPPPKPPTMKPPPPPPVRSVSNTNLTHLPPSLSLAPSSQDNTGGTSSPATEPTSFGSVNNVSSLTLADELRAKVSNVNLSVTGSSANSISTGNLSVLGGGNTLSKGGSLKTTAAPPLPPHRTSPAPPPPVPASTLNSGDAPVPPQRISSIRNSAGSGSLTAVPIVGSVTSSSNISSHSQSHHSQSSTVIITSTSTSTGGGSLHRKESSLTSVSSSSSTANNSKMPLPEIDLEAKYAFYFHKVTELPQPIPFLNVPKIYQSELRQQQQQQGGVQQQPHRQ
uniref:WH2 domain-containing protein n=1 Tax=Anopheles christyi TaxID=43041 RepID=A0A182K9K4_9DIPT